MNKFHVSKTLILVHPSFQKKIWKQLLDKIVILYFNSMIIFCGKASKDDHNKILSKMENDKQLIDSNFGGYLYLLSS